MMQAPRSKSPSNERHSPRPWGSRCCSRRPAEIDAVDVTISFARYERERIKDEGEKGPGRVHWRRVPYGPEAVKVPLDSKTIAKGIAVPNTIGAKLIGRLETITDGDRVGIESGTRALSIFLVNEQALTDDDHRDEYTFFQVQMELRSPKPLVPRPNRRGERSLTDLDARISELQYRKRVEYAVGHNVGVEPVLDKDKQVHAVRTRWLPETEVSLVDARPLDGVEVGMEQLAQLDGGANIRAALGRLPEAYREWIAKIRSQEVGSKDRTETRNHLMNQAELACRRIEAGIALLEQDAEALQAFRIANESMALASRKRTPERGEPRWRLFQLAFLLLNLPATADPKHKDRETTELIFFPTGGGKTEAYLGLIAFTLALRRMRGRLGAPRRPRRRRHSSIHAPPPHPRPARARDGPHMRTRSAQAPTPPTPRRPSLRRRPLGRKKRGRQHHETDPDRARRLPSRHPRHLTMSRSKHALGAKRNSRKAASSSGPRRRRPSASSSAA